MIGGIVVSDEAIATPIPFNPDTPPAVAGALDDEFAAAEFNADGRWSLSDAGAMMPLSQQASWLQASQFGTYQATPFALSQPILGVPFQVTAKLVCGAGCGANTAYVSNSVVGIGEFTDGTNGGLLFFVGVGSDNVPSIGILQPGVAWVRQDHMVIASPIYLRIADDGTNLALSYSFDGVNYIAYETVAKSQATGPLTKVGFFNYASSGYASYLKADYFRSIFLATPEPQSL